MPCGWCKIRAWPILALEALPTKFSIISQDTWKMQLSSSLYNYCLLVGWHSLGTWRFCSQHLTLEGPSKAIQQTLFQLWYNLCRSGGRVNFCLRIYSPRPYISRIGAIPSSNQCWAMLPFMFPSVPINRIRGQPSKLILLHGKTSARVEQRSWRKDGITKPCARCSRAWSIGKIVYKRCC